MKIVAVLDVDENKLAEIDAKAEGENGWYMGPGVIIQSHKIIEEAGNYEYAAFAWNEKLEAYEQMGRAVMTELLCRNRFYEYVRKGWFQPHYDTSKVIFKRRVVSEFYGRWESIDNEN